MATEQSSLAVEIEDNGPCSKRVKITVPSERVDREIEDTFKNVSKTVQFRGFRPGKAPRKLVEAKLGDRVLSDVKERLVQQVVGEAVEQSELDALGEAEANWDEIEVAKGTDLAFEVTLDVRPEFDLPDLASLTATPPVVDVTDEMIDQEIDRLRLQRATSEDAGDEPLADRGIASIHVKISVGDETIVDVPEVEWAHPSNVLGGMLVEGLADGMLGKKKGETAEFTVELPADFAQEEHRGKEAAVELVVEGVQHVSLPELDEEFAAELDYDDIEELRDDVRKQLDRAAETQRSRAVDAAIVDAILEATPFEVPPSLLKRETIRMLQRYQTQLRQDGVPDDQIREQLAQVTAEAETRVKRDVRASFVLDSIATERKVFATENDVQQELAQMAAAYDRTPAEMEDYMERQGMLGSLRGSIRERKTLAELRDVVTLGAASEDTPASDEGDDA